MLETRPGVQGGPASGDPRSPSRAVVRALVLAAAALAGWSGLACERSAEPAPAERVILVAVDGAEWQVLDRLIAEGRLPHVGRMKREGATGKLRSLEPIFSPVVWATISTGMLPRKHGIESFTVEWQGRRVPVTSNLFRVSRVWEILSRRNRTVGVVGWWTTWPAVPVNGFLCSERTWPLVIGEQGWPITSERPAAVTHRTHPEELYESVRSLVVTRDSLTPEQLQRVDVRGGLAMVGRTGPSVADMYAKDLTFSAIGTTLYPLHRPDFFTVYLELPDVMAHYFWDHWRYYRFRRYGEPTGIQDPPSGVDPDRAAWIGRNLERAYEFVDGVVGQLMAQADDRTLMLVVSDHGYGANPERQRRHVGDGLYRALRHWHHLDGVILAWGSGVEPGATIANASVTDVTPTVLHALGEPIGDDMDGSVLLDLFRRDLRQRPPARIPSHETGESRSPVPLPSPDDAAQLELLRSLGYVP